MAAKDVAPRETLGDVWCDVARCAPFLKTLLPDNVIWKSDEKVWLEHVTHNPDPQMVAWAINHGGPKTVWKTLAVKKLAEEYGLFHFEGAEITGPVSYIPPRPGP